MTTTKEALKRALEALKANHEHHKTYDDYGGYPESELCEQNMAAIAALEALAQPSQEPVYYSITVNGQHCGNFWPDRKEADAAAKRLNASYPQDARAVVPLYTHPQPSAPVAQALDHKLVDELRKRYEKHSPDGHEVFDYYGFAKALLSTAPQVEAKEGWKLVPIEPTPEMLDAAARASMQHLIDCINDPTKANEVGSEENVRKTHAARYRSMIEVAPSSQKEGEQPK